MQKKVSLIFPLINTCFSLLCQIGKLSKLLNFRADSQPYRKISKKLIAIPENCQTPGIYVFLMIQCECNLTIFQFFFFEKNRKILMNFSHCALEKIRHQQQAGMSRMVAVSGTVKITKQ